MKSRLVCVVLSTSALVAMRVAAQPPEPAPPPPDKLFVLGNTAPLPTLGARIDIIRTEGGIPGPVVKGKPYSARSITESTQTLADGNRITQRNESVVYRDSEGRTRREQTLKSVGPWETAQPVTMITIHDPVVGNSYVLDPLAKAARQIRPFQMNIARAEAELVKAADETRALYAPGVPLPAPAAGITVVEQAPGQEAVVFTRPVAGAFAVAPFPEGTTGMYEPGEDLGEQVLEGLLTQGTRMTDTIPAGVIGNERAIDVVTERWYSKDIEALVLERFSDPRAGETVYRLVNVVLGDPSPALFEVPQGYEIEASEAPRPGVHVLPSKVVEFELQRTAPAQ